MKIAYAILWTITIAVLLFTAACWAVGVYLCFHASIILGIICLATECPAPIIGAIYLFGGLDVAQLFVDWLGSEFGVTLF